MTAPKAKRRTAERILEAALRLFNEAIAAYLPTLRQHAAQIKAAIDQHEAAIDAKFNRLREALA